MWPFHLSTIICLGIFLSPTAAWVLPHCLKALWQVQTLSVDQHNLYIELTEKTKAQNNTANSQRAKLNSL